MASNKRFDEGVLNTLEQWLSAQNNDQEQLRNDAIFEIVGEMLGLRGATSQETWGVLRGLKVSDGAAGMDIDVDLGLAMIYDTTAGWLTTGRSRYRPIFLEDGVTLTVPAADPANPRIDLVLAKPALYNADSEVVNFKSAPPAAAFKRQRVALRTGTYADFTAGNAELCIKTGTPAGSPVAPSVDAGAVAIAEIAVGAAVVVINPADITDRRRPAFPQGRPRVVLYAKSDGTGLDPARLLVEEGGARFVSHARTVNPGLFTVEVSGVGPDPVVNVTLLGAFNNPRTVWLTTHPGYTAGVEPTIFAFQIWDTAGGAAANVDHIVEVLGSGGYDGGLD